MGMRHVPCGVIERPAPAWDGQQRAGHRRILSHAITTERCPAATKARSSAANTCSAPPTASGPTGASG